MKKNGKKYPVNNWGLYIKVGESDDFIKPIYFAALNGGEAKHAALPMLQRYLEENQDVKRIWALLRRTRDGNGSRYAPAYAVAKRYTYRKELLEARRSSEVFREAINTIHRNSKKNRRKAFKFFRKVQNGNASV